MEQYVKALVLSLEAIMRNLEQIETDLIDFDVL